MDNSTGFCDDINSTNACLCILNSGCCYGWITPILGHLMGPDSEIPMTTEEAPWVISIIELGNLISPIPAGILMDRVGRKPVILATAPIFIFTWLLVIYYPSTVMLAVARVAHGIAMGLALTAVPVYLGEIASNAVRGAITSIMYISWWSGFLLQYAVGPFFSFTTYTYFTLSLNILLVLFYFQPESPYYYLMIDDEERAIQSLKSFRDSTPDSLNEELLEMRKGFVENRNANGVKYVVSTPTDRKALALIIILTAVRLLSGTGALLVYSTELFSHTPNLAISADAVTITVGIVSLIGGFVSSFVSDVMGRRPLLMISCIGSLICQLLNGTYYLFLFKTSIEVSHLSWIAPSLVVIYVALCSAGLYPVCSSYTSELFTSHTRGIASSLAAISATFASFLSLFIYQPIESHFGVYLNFYIYALCTFLGLVFFYFTAPETKGKSFAQIRRELSNEKDIKDKMESP